MHVQCSSNTAEDELELIPEVVAPLSAKDVEAKEEQ